jgi:hypothetical protein
LPSAAPSFMTEPLRLLTHDATVARYSDAIMLV